MPFFDELKRKIQKAQGQPDEEFVESATDEYVELGTDEELEHRSKMLVRPYTLDDFEDIKGPIDALRDGNVVVLINIKPLREKDLTELKRAIAKLRKTCDALEGEIAGFTEDIVVATGNNARIHKTKQVEDLEE